MTDAQPLAPTKVALTKVRDIVLMFGVALAIFVPVWMVVSALGVKFGLWDWAVGLLKMIRGIGLPLLGFLILETITASILVLLAKPRAGFGALAFMWAVSLSGTMMALNAVKTAGKVPPIHDISTSPMTPLNFSEAVLAARGAKSNPITIPKDTVIPFNKERLSAFSGRTQLEAQTDAYPTIKPLVIEGKSPADIFKAVEASAKANGLKIVTSDPTKLVLEGYAESLWFGFKDDVIIAVQPIANGGQVDIRSVSRVGISDMGANAKRIEKLLAGVSGH